MVGQVGVGSWAGRPGLPACAGLSLKAGAYFQKYRKIESPVVFFFFVVFHVALC